MDIIPRVIDTSHYDDVEDAFAGAVKAGIWGCINKVTEGYGGHDASFDWRRKPAKDAGLLYGGYHFLRPGPVVRQAEWFLHSIGDPTGLVLALDHEDSNVSLDNAQHFCELVKQEAGRYPVLYSGFLVKEQITAHDTFWKGIRLWLSHYSAHPTWPDAIWTAPWLWQYTGDGTGPSPHGVPGVSPYNQLDVNSYQNSQDQLAKEWVSDVTTAVVSVAVTTSQPRVIPRFARLPKKGT